ncbi:MAG: acyl-CoA dehydrogenase family protein, partial [Acidimicrobiia bacterium]|nr:acyl-CoA dehydrogenase family protein [Acidimicrobiia bacterium]
MTWPVEFGGGGRPPIERFVVTEQLIIHGAAIAASWVADRQMGPSIIAFGTREQQERFLPGILAGETCWCIGMSEPDAGSDLAGIRTRAERDGDEFVLNGAKIWTSWAHEADYCYLIARTNATARPHEGLSELIVDMRSPGITVRPIIDMTGDAHFCEVVFEDVRVPAANLVGALDGSWRQLMRQLEHERGGIDRLM